MDKVSIIVPNYNSEEYISDCIDSLINQTYHNIEIIIVDDCSTDNSVKIVKEYIKNKSNVCLIKLNNNKGVSNARNKGIEKASGKYIMFSDSDDWYEKDAVEKMVNVAKKEKADFVVANYYINKGNKKVKIDISNYFSKSEITKKEAISYMSLTSSSKLIERSLFVNNDIKYPENIKRCEELSVIPVLSYLSKKSVFISESLYHYRQRNNSASNIVQKDLSYFDISFSKFIDLIDKDKYLEEIEFRAIEHFLYSKTLVMLKSKYSNYDIKEHIKQFKKQYPSFMNNKYLKEFSLPKRIFIKTLTNNFLLFSKTIAFIHKILTG